MLDSCYNEDVLFTGGTAKGLVVPPTFWCSYLRKVHPDAQIIYSGAKETTVGGSKAFNSKHKYLHFAALRTPQKAVPSVCANVYLFSQIDFSQTLA